MEKLSCASGWPFLLQVARSRAETKGPRTARIWTSEEQVEHEAK
jgi:hypothetical protein